VQKHFLILLGMRPEAIKLFPVINRLKGQRCIAITVCATAQHRHLLDQVLRLTKVVPDLDLNLMTTNQTLDHLAALLICYIGQVSSRLRPTKTGLVHHRIPVSHLEAGLRSVDIYLPWPYGRIRIA
jgi:UDP-N-acetylglucosamine 2-epimerase (non-hydrolysing)